MLALAILRRLGLLLVVSAVLFAATEVLPGDPATRLLGLNSTPERVAALRAELGLDQPAPTRYLDWIAGVVQGDFGNSIVTGQPVASIVSQRLLNSLILAGLAFAGIVVVSLSLGLVTGARAGTKADSGLSFGALVVASLPEFVLATMLIVVLAAWLGLLPAVSLVPAGRTALAAPSVLVLPVLSMIMVGSAYAMRLVRAAVIDANRLAHVESARLRGLSEHRVLIHHLLPSAIGPIAQTFAYLSTYVVGGTIVIERIFNYPGLGSQLANSISGRDIPVIQTVGLIVAVVIVASSALADAIGAAANPRVRKRVA